MTDLILAFDTSGPYCAAALLAENTVLAAQTLELGRGQAEQLMPLLEELLYQAAKSWSDLSAIGVGIGPGNFTGIRISVSAARGLALALNIPAIGVSSFEAVAQGLEQPALPAVPGPREQAYVAPQGQPPYLASKDELQELALDLPLVTPDPHRIAIQIAQVAAGKRGTPQPAPAPLYIKAADAAPPRDPAPVILSDDA